MQGRLERRRSSAGTSWTTWTWFLTQTTSEHYSTQQLWSRSAQPSLCRWVIWFLYVSCVTHIYLWRRCRSYYSHQCVSLFVHACCFSSWTSYFFLFSVLFVCIINHLLALWLCGAGIACLLEKMAHRKRVTVAVDGSVYKFHPRMRELMNHFTGKYAPGKEVSEVSQEIVGCRVVGAHLERHLRGVREFTLCFKISWRQAAHTWSCFPCDSLWP